MLWRVKRMMMWRGAVERSCGEEQRRGAEERSRLFLVLFCHPVAAGRRRENLQRGFAFRVPWHDGGKKSTSAAQHLTPAPHHPTLPSETERKRSLKREGMQLFAFPPR
ncbi:hypothetical protein EYF80_035316 [Liparis tanakae]|uniref:Uncharacterized protein n=1 Tax=Liparis tanakae TaxID=230148 RepID=A0A4Z2GLJ3_9TELE|nr:hypothetical protein EYF80_035316 [Liparis tanakae]